MVSHNGYKYPNSPRHLYDRLVTSPENIRSKTKKTLHRAQKHYIKYNVSLQRFVRIVIVCETMAASRRLQKELSDLQKSTVKSFRNVCVDETNMLLWRVLLVPDNPPYNKGAFHIEINFPAEYPFKPPKVLFKTKIYHPNIDEQGQVCLPIIQAEHWKPATKTEQVIQALVALVNDPEPEHPLRTDLAHEFSDDHKRFLKNAEEFTKKNAAKRPSD